MRAQQTAVRDLVQTDSTACPAPVRSGARDSTEAALARDTARGPRAAAQGDNAAIVLRASASAREVRFASPPRIRVRLCGALMDSVRVVERRNLPDSVQAGTTYRDVYIAVEILGHLNARCLASRIGVSQRQSDADACASIGIRDSASARPAAQRPPP